MDPPRYGRRADNHGVEQIFGQRQARKCPCSARLLPDHLLLGVHHKVERAGCACRYERHHHHKRIAVPSLRTRGEKAPVAFAARSKSIKVGGSEASPDRGVGRTPCSRRRHDPSPTAPTASPPSRAARIFGSCRSRSSAAARIQWSSAPCSGPCFRGSRR